ncbi:MAG: type II toxin-antitoxin system VapC family toxin [Salinibacter sp.]
MEKTFVDTGIVVAVVLGESTRDRILEETRNTHVISASSLPYEVGNALTRNVLREDIAASTARDAYQLYEKMPIQLVDVDIGAGFDCALSMRDYAYDGYMLEAALRHHQARFLSLDRDVQEAAREYGLNVIDI